MRGSPDARSAVTLYRLCSDVLARSTARELPNLRSHAAGLQRADLPP